MQRKIDDALFKLSQEATDLYLSREIPVIDSPPSPLVFLRDFVAPNKPVIIKNCLKNWSACTKWTNEYLKNTLGNTYVTVTATPNGYADAPVGDRFLLPDEKIVPFKDFLGIWQNKCVDNGVYYIQKQNSNFMDEFSVLIADADSHINWASEAFGTKPDAVNFWMGNSHSITSMHKDHYENIYAVVRGCKTFVLHPPTDIHHIPYRTYKLAQYKENKEKMTFDVIDIFEDAEIPKKDAASAAGKTDAVIADESILINKGGKLEGKKTDILIHKTISWIAIDPLCPDYITYPQYKNCNRYVAKVEAGDVLYLPSLWFHHVSQSDNTIAVNFWYDMQYDIRYNYFKFAEEVSAIASSAHVN